MKKKVTVKKKTKQNQYELDVYYSYFFHLFHFLKLVAEVFLIRHVNYLDLCLELSEFNIKKFSKPNLLILP